MKLNDRTISKMEEWMSESRKARTGLMALAFAAHNPKTNGASWTWQSTNEACTGKAGDMINYWKAEDSIFVCAYNGGTPQDRGSGGTVGLYGGGPFTFEGNEMSLAWLEYITGPEAPWNKVSNLRDHIIGLDNLSKVNYETGFIIRDLANAPAEALFSFLMASRYAQENARRCVVWWELVKEGVDPNIALIYSHTFKIDGTFSGPVAHSVCMIPVKYWAKQFYTGPVIQPTLCRENGLRGTHGADKWFLSPDHKPSGNYADIYFRNDRTYTKAERLAEIKEFLGV